MAVAAPVLERDADTKEREYRREYTREYRDDYNFTDADEKHNSRISENYAKLINPESKPKDIIAKETQRADAVGVIAPAREVETESLYLVENARADADIFRADSSINRRKVEVSAATVTASQVADEEENEDLRPTQTTIQYKTEGVKRTVEEGKIEIRSEAKSETKRKSVLNKKDKIIIAVALTVIVALFVLIIVNSAVISNLNNDVNALQSTLSQAESTYEQALAAKNAYLEEENFFQTVSDFAIENGMIRR